MKTIIMLAGALAFAGHNATAHESEDCDRSSDKCEANAVAVYTVCVESGETQKVCSGFLNTQQNRCEKMRDEEDG